MVPAYVAGDPGSSMSHKPRRASRRARRPRAVFLPLRPVSLDRACIHAAPHIRTLKTMSAPVTETAKSDSGNSLRSAMASRVVVADGAMGTMLQASDATLDDFDGHEGCNEILNVTRPDIVRSVHDAYYDAGADCVTTNTFGANFANLGEYGISDRIGELSEAGARIARQAADAGPRRTARAGCSARSGPGPSCRPSATSRSPPCATPTRRTPPGLLRGGRRRAHRRDLPGPAADQGRHHRRPPRHRRGRARRGADQPRHHRDHRHHAARQRDRRRADRAGAAGHRRHRAELRHRARRR